MNKVNVSIKGIVPLLQHRFPMEDNKENKSIKKKKEFVDLDECEKSLYQDAKGKIYQPAEHILGALIKAGTNFNYEKKKSFKDVIKSSVFITPDIIYHINQKWDIDRRAVVIMKARIVRARPKFINWELAFEIEHDEEIMSSSKLKEILDYAGNRVGLGDYRPLYGRFMVTKFED